jgi:hypothetical protein
VAHSAATVAVVLQARGGAKALSEKVERVLAATALPAQQSYDERENCQEKKPHAGQMPLMAGAKAETGVPVVPVRQEFLELVQPEPELPARESPRRRSPGKPKAGSLAALLPVFAASQESKASLVEKGGVYHVLADVAETGELPVLLPQAPELLA